MLNIKKILCPMDFSEPSQAALEVARELAVSYDAELQLLHVVPFPAPNPKAFSSEQEAEELVREEAEVKFRTLLQGGESFVVRVGDAAGHILSMAKTEGIDVIVMSTHGLTGWRRFVLGSVTEQVLQQASCPVLSVHRAFSHQTEHESGQATGLDGVQPTSESSSPPVLQGLAIKKILCPTDFSEPSYAALQTAGDLAEKFNAELCVLNVMEPLEPVLGIVSKAEFNAARSADIAHEIHLAIQKYARAGVHTRALVEIGDPAPGILDAANQEQADLIVIATNGATGWRQFVFGSVASAVVRLAPQLVLTVYAPSVHAPREEQPQTRQAQSTDSLAAP